MLTTSKGAKKPGVYNIVDSAHFISTRKVRTAKTGSIKWQVIKRKYGTTTMPTWESPTIYPIVHRFVLETGERAVIYIGKDEVTSYEYVGKDSVLLWKINRRK